MPAGIAHGVAHLVTEDEQLGGRFVTLHNRRQVNFGSCSYVGLETDLRPWLAEESFAAERALWSRLFTDGRVSILPGEVFHSPVPGWFRLCHTADPQAVGEGIYRLRRVIEGVRPVGVR